MSRNNEKRYIPGTNPNWDRELPDEDANSLVDKAGNNWDNGYNFDEKDDSDEETTFDNLKDKIEFDPKKAEELKKH